jgi:hypothetical protein
MQGNDGGSGYGMRNYGGGGGYSEVGDYGEYGGGLRGSPRQGGDVGSSALHGGYGSPTQDGAYGSSARPRRPVSDSPTVDPNACWYTSPSSITGCISVHHATP